MPFDNGSLALTYFYLSDKLPEDYLEKFSSYKAGTLDSVKDEQQIGWVTGRTLLESEINEETAIRGGHLFLQMRTAERKVPAILLKAICQREELAFMAANQTEKVPSKVKKDIREEATEKHLMKMPPGIGGTPFVVDMSNNMLYLGTASTKQIENFVGFFYKTTGVEPIQMSVGEMMFRLFKTGENEIPELLFSDDADDEPIPARDFLTWLWYFYETESNRVEVGSYGDIEMMIEDPLVFAFASQTKGAGETAVKKGDRPLHSPEAQAALNVGKKLKKAKLTFTRGQDIWSCSFDADRFAFTGLKLPVGEEMDAASRFAERITNLEIFHDIILEYFRLFAESIRGENGKKLAKDVLAWAKKRVNN